MRKKIVAGNWKMNMTTAEAAALVNALKADLANFREVEVVVCPPFTAPPRYRSSFSIRKPATLVPIYLQMTAVEACARCAAPKASLTKISP